MLKDTLNILISEKYIGSSKRVNRTYYLDLFMEHKIDFDNIKDVHFVQRAFSIEFIKPLHLNDKVIIKSSISKLGSSSFVLKQEITNNNVITTTAQTVYVSVNDLGDKILLPDNIRAQLSE